MTREKEILNAATEARMASAETLTTRGTHHSIDDIPFIDEMITYDEVAENAFIKGAKWADEHPKSPWISVKEDLPCNHKALIWETEIYEGTETIRVLAADRRGNIWIDYMIYEDGKWRWKNFETDFWMFRPKLPEE